MEMTHAEAVALDKLKAEWAAIPVQPQEQRRGIDDEANRRAQARWVGRAWLTFVGVIGLGLLGLGLAGVEAGPLAVFAAGVVVGFFGVVAVGSVAAAHRPRR
jgi:hypothetical protein